MRQIHNNRTLYIAVTELCRAQKSNSRSLEDYLLTLYALIQPKRNHKAVLIETFFQMLESAFVDVPETFHETWQTTNWVKYDACTFMAFEQILIRQILDLREMDEVGTLQNELRGFGVDAPRGARWYNFMPVDYLECATDGCFGGWDLEDDTGRAYVSGKVAYIKEDGTVGTANPEDFENSIVEINEISWETFSDFLQCGRLYE